MGRARARLNGDEASARSDKTTSVSRVIYRMAEATMFWMIADDRRERRYCVILSEGIKDAEVEPVGRLCGSTDGISYILYARCA